MDWLSPFLLGIFAGVVALGGPEDAWLRFRWIWDGHPPPIVVSMKPDPDEPEGTYIATLRNPSWKSVAITGYAASSSVGLAMATGGNDDGGVTIMQTREPKPADCTGLRKVALARPLKIEPDGLRALRVRPWQKTCWFEVRFYSDHGETMRSSVFGPLELGDLEQQLDRLKGAAKQTCPDGAVVLATETCPPPAPPPPPSVDAMINK